MQNAGMWIPCSEKMPDYADRVLVAVREADIDYVGVAIDRRDQHGDGTHWKTYRDVVAWMPLPEPYKESDNE